MAYHIYTTRGLILKGLPHGESDKYYYIFTEDLGLIMASAKSVRKEESKLRFGLSDYVLSELSFIRGKNRWKITHAREIENLYRTFASEPQKGRVVARILEMLQKLLSGEEKHIELFTLISLAFQFLSLARLTSTEMRAFEAVLMLRILRLLGYGKEGRAYDSCIHTTVWSGNLLEDASLHIKQMISDINQALEASQL